MISIKEFIKKWPDELVLEMATFGEEKWGNNIYRIAVHGPASKDREQPHIHIYLSNDKAPYNNFNFEISLIDIVCYDEINLIYQRDKETNKLIKHKNKCSWEGYRKIKNCFVDWLFDKPSKPGEYIDNLDVAIDEYNRESNYTDWKNGRNTFLKYIHERGLRILPQYFKYFSSDDLEQYHLL